jgi:restriction system protein
MWRKLIHHQGLNAFRVVKGETQEEVELLAQFQMDTWDERWKRRQQAEVVRNEKLGRLQNLDQKKSAAHSLSAEISARINGLETLLKRGVVRGRYLQWEDLKDQSTFTEPLVPKIKLDKEPSAPTFESFRPILSIIDRLIPTRKAKKEATSNDEFHKAYEAWLQSCSDIRVGNAASLEMNKRLVSEREARRKKHEEAKAEQHSKTGENKKAFLEGSAPMAEYFFTEVLSRSESLENFPDEFVVEYKSTSKTLLVDYEFPNSSALPTHKEVKYVATRNMLQYVPVSEIWLKKTYDDVLYQITLRSLHELFIHDDAEFLQSIVFNGWVRSIDKSTGTEAHACILSIHANRNEFMTINLSQVDPKACFRKLKGVASSKLVELAPIRPVMSLSRDDERFVDPYEVLHSVDERTNLAAMDWLDFENLIREVFEKEFSKNGGEVKITQASRDGGVDAIAFDPDPIRGGKIVIQAKRYTNVVGVAAVRDLYGTVHNEGATKGILVTTSAFGPDAYEFAKGKPLTLLSGSELLFLLERHGHSGKIDLAEAKMEYRQSQKKN